MDAAYELFDHTADIGIRVTAPSLDGLVQPAVEGLYAVIGEPVPSGDPRPFAYRVPGDDPAESLRDFLSELLTLFEQDRRMVTAIDKAELSDRVLAVRGRTEAVDPDRSDFQREAKAVTYHELRIARVPDGYEARIIIDI